MAELSLDDVLEVEDRDEVDVDVPEWGGTVKVRPISAKLRWRFEATVMGCEASGDWSPLAEVSLDIVCEALGAGKSHRAKLAGKSAAALDRVRNAAMKAAGMDDAAIDKAAQDFGTAPTGSSDTG